MPDINIAQIQLTDEEIDAAVRVLRSGMLRQGKECEGFEKEFAAKTGANFAVTNANGTAALHLAYLCILQPGDEVLVPTFTFFATASMVAVTGAKPVMSDVDPNSYLIDLSDAEKRITPRTRAIVPVHLFGNVVDFDAVKAFAAKHNLAIVWDAAQAHGATLNGRDVGSLEGFVCYSFYPSKNMFVGEGGMTCTDSEEKAQKLRNLRSHGQTGPYLHTELGLNYRMTDVEAAIGREQLKRLDEMISTRRRNAAILNEGLAGVEGIRPQQITPGCESAWHQYCIVVDPEAFGCDRDALSAKLKEQGIATGVHYPRGLHQQPVFEEMYGTTSLPNAEHLARNILALPVHHGLSEEDCHSIVEGVVSSRA